MRPHFVKCLSRWFAGHCPNHTWDVKPHTDSAVPMAISGHTEVLSAILSPNPVDLQGRVGQHPYSPSMGPDGATLTVPCQVMAHGAFHLTGQHSHTPHGGCHIHCRLQNGRRFCFCGNTAITSNSYYQQWGKRTEIVYFFNQMFFTGLLCIYLMFQSGSRDKNKKSGTFFFLTL